MHKAKSFIIERRHIPPREVKNYELHIQRSEGINGERLVLPKARTNTRAKESDRKPFGVSSIYSW